MTRNCMTGAICGAMPRDTFSEGFDSGHYPGIITQVNPGHVYDTDDLSVSHVECRHYK